MRTIALITAFALAACATRPEGPTVQVLPQQGKPFEVFAADQATCKAYANNEIGPEDQHANNLQAFTTVGTALLGAGLGAAVGGGRGALIGAAGGGVLGTSIGAGGARDARESMQDRYDNAYSQCMYARHNQVPVVRQRPVQVVVPSYGYGYRSYDCGFYGC